MKTATEWAEGLLDLVKPYGKHVIVDKAGVTGIIQQAINEAYQAGQREMQRRAASLDAQKADELAEDGMGRENYWEINAHMQRAKVIRALPILEEPK